MLIGGRVLVAMLILVLFRLFLIDAYRGEGCLFLFYFWILSHLGAALTFFHTPAFRIKDVLELESQNVKIIIPLHCVMNSWLYIYNKYNIKKRLLYFFSKNLTFSTSKFLIVLFFKFFVGQSAIRLSRIPWDDGCAPNGH